MNSAEETHLVKSNKRNSLLKSNSTNSFGTIFIYNLDIIKSKRIHPRTPNKTPKNDLKIKKNLFLPEEQKFFCDIKNKKVRNFYETILRNSCKEKEPKLKHLKNIFRLKNTKINLLKPKMKNEIDIIINLQSNKEKKSRTSNNLPFIQLSQNQNLNNVNSFYNSNINGDIDSKTIINYNNKIPSLFLKKDKKNTNLNQSNNVNILPISFDYKNKKIIKRKSISFLDELISYDKKGKKKQNSVEYKKIRKMKV